MEETTGPNRSTVPLEGQPQLQPTTRQRILNIVSEQVAVELEGMLETQGLYIIRNEHVANLVKKKVIGIFDDSDISGRKMGTTIIFNSRVMSGHNEGGNLDLGGIKPEYRDAGQFVVDKDIELKIYTVPKEKKRDRIDLINGGKLPNELDSI